ncbi:LLM class flavin-dependent oxidoreductase [Cryptosporangium phraense]|uniref:LLM class flavin-dependent oxidoreductase n=1 Tax=Cryptosporangium phraense TaxID=2593070 RepID=A0A545AXE9_9ACTN|nr:LLM class flavin-dependent oxidoreductase [Cryptosporangium phraense]TQS46013.1 LLM class flavin-dependent oxidoreductase [Cryptosporangium phraense]
MTITPLGVLDLIPRSSGESVGAAVRNAIDLARQTERFGYTRYWFAEHHLNPGVLGSSPAVSIALAAAATSTIRIGSAGVQFGHRQPLATVEEFGLLDAAYPGRIDLGIGRSFGRQKPPVPEPAAAEPAEPAEPVLAAAGAGAAAQPVLAAAATAYLADRGRAAHTAEERAENGLLLPKHFDVSRLLQTAGPKIAAQLDLLQQPGAYTPSYDEQIGDVLALLAGTHPAGHANPGEGADVQVWILGASGGSSATVAGRNGLRFVASYHHSPSTVLDAVRAYRAAFTPSADLDRPHVSVSADVVVGETDEQAAVLASGYAPWVHSIRSGAGAIAYPTPDEAAAYPWDPDLVKDRVDTQFVGAPGTVADRLEQLRDATGADELVITTITHDHADRVRSYQLLAEEWSRR